MNLNTFTPSSPIYGTMKQDATITFSKKGANNLSDAACLICGFKESDRIAIHQDLDNPTEWYISNNDNGFVLNKPRSDYRGLNIYSTEMAFTVLKSLGIAEESYTFFIGDMITSKNINYYPIITSRV